MAIKYFSFFILLFLLTSCVSHKKIVYLNQNSIGESGVSALEYTNLLQPDDNLIITVTSDEPLLAAPFNLLYTSLQSSQVNNANNELLYTYQIDKQGEIFFAGIGKLKLAGLTRIEAENKIKKELEKQIKDPGVLLRVTNFKVSVMGEVSRPGIIPVTGDRITLLEAISGAGDLTIYGVRTDILVIREKEGVVTVNSIDITKSDFINSPFYYLDHNDVVYVKPNNTRVNSSMVGPNLTLGISALSLLVTIIAISLR